MVSRSAPEIAGVTVVDSVNTAVETARGFGKTVYSAGGAQIYAQTLPRAERIYLSVIKGEFDGDAFFPEFDRAEWEQVAHREHPDFDFFDYRRNAPPTGS